MSTGRKAILVATLWLLAGWASAAPVVTADEVAARFFEEKVRPILAEHCYECHGPSRARGRRSCASTRSRRCSAAASPARRSSAGEPGPEPADPRRPPRGRRGDAAQEEARAGRDRRPGRLGQDGGPVARDAGRHGSRRPPRRRRRPPAMGRGGTAVLGVPAP